MEGEADVCLFISRFLFYLSVGDLADLIYLPPSLSHPRVPLYFPEYFSCYALHLLHPHHSPPLCPCIFTFLTLLSICLFAEWEDVGTSVGVTSAAEKSPVSQAAAPSICVYSIKRKEILVDVFICECCHVVCRGKKHLRILATLFIYLNFLPPF